MISDEMLQRCLEEIEILQMSVSEYLALNPGLEPLEEPLRAAEALRALTTLSMHPDVMHAQEQRLRAAVRAYAPSPTAQTRPRLGRRVFGVPLLRLGFALLLIISLALAGAGTVRAASASIPGESLYPVKQTLEAVQVQFTPASGQATLHADLAEERREELVVLLIRRAQADLFERTAAAMTAETQAALEYIDRATPASRSALLERLVNLIDRQLAFLVSVRDEMPTQASANLALALQATQAHAAQAQALLGNHDSHDQGSGQGTTQPPETQIAGGTPPATDNQTQLGPTQVPPSQTEMGATLTDEPSPATGPAPFRTPTPTRRPSTTTTIPTNPPGSTAAATLMTPNAATPFAALTNTPPGPPLPSATATQTQVPTSTPTDAATSTPTPSPTGPPLPSATATRIEAPTGTPTDAPTSTPTASRTATPTMAPTDTAVMAYEGCEPGYWKQADHLDSWVITGYAPSDDFNTVFGVSAFNPYTLLAAVGLEGGGEKALARQAVAALLNAAHPNVFYRYTVIEVIGAVQNAYAAGDFESVKDLLEAANLADCPLN